MPVWDFIGICGGPPGGRPPGGPAHPAAGPTQGPPPHRASAVHKDHYSYSYSYRKNEPGLARGNAVGCHGSGGHFPYKWGKWARIA